MSVSHDAGPQEVFLGSLVKIVPVCGSGVDIKSKLFTCMTDSGN